MAKNKISEWSATPANNTDVGGINIGEGMLPSDVNNAMREMMAQIKDQQAGTDGDDFTVGGNLAVTGTATATSFTGALNGSLGATTPSTVTATTVTATTVTASGIIGTSATGALIAPTGTTGQRPTAASGMFRLNSTTQAFEGYNGVAWGSIGGGATGAGGDAVFQENSLIVTTSYTLTSAKSASSVGPITINSGATVTVPSGSRWVVL